MPSPGVRPASLFSASLLLALFISSCGGGGNGGGYGGGGGGGGTPALHATITTSGNFSGGATGATYTINVTNTGTAATGGTTTVVDPPMGFTVVTMTGTGWMCTIATTTCTYANSVAAGQAFPPITATGNVTAMNGSSVTISLMLSGGGAASVSSSPTVSVAAVALSITKSHTGNFTQAQVGATYSVVVMNAAGAGATSGMVTVTEATPSGLTVTGMSGTNWSCAVATKTCTRSDALAGGSSYDTITVTVTVATNAPASVTNQVTVTGGNQSGTAPQASDLTTITPLPILQITTSSLPSGTAGEAYGPSGAGATVTASGGVSPYTWGITGLPSGLMFTSGTPSATISGNTCQVGSFMVKATVTDSASPAAVVSATITLTIAPGTLSITTTSPLTNATLSTSYSTMVAATSGCAPYTWSLATGSSLPAMMSLTSGSPSATISGTPTVTGTYKFTLQVTDSESPALTVSATFLLTSTESPNVTCPTTVNLTLCGTYIMGLRGFNDPAGPIGLGGDFVADNAGHIATSGNEDINSSASATGGQTFTITGGSYVMDASGDGRGVVTLIYSDASSTSYRFALVSANGAAPGNDSPIEEFDASGALASGVIVGPKALPLVPPAPGFLALSLEGANGSGQRVGLLGEVQFAGSVTIGCDGTSGTFVSIAGENVIVNTQGTMSNVTFAGSCASGNDFGTTGRSTAMATVSGGTPFANSTLHFVFYQLTFSTYFFLEMDPIAQSQPILSGIANVLTPVSGQTGFFVDCPCIFTEHGTTDGTITTGHSSVTVTRLISMPAGSGGTLTGIEDRNAGGTVTSAAAVSGTYTVNNDGVGTMTLTAPTARTIHFIIDGFDGTNNSSSYNFDTLDESASVDVGVSHAQFNTVINSPGSPYVFGMGFDDLPYGLAFGYGDPGTTPLNAQTVGVVTPTGTSTLGTLAGIADVMPGLVAGSAASGNYTIDSTTGRGTGSVSLTNGSPINVVYWVLGIGKFLVLDVQTTNPDLIGMRQQ